MTEPQSSRTALRTANSVIQQPSRWTELFVCVLLIPSFGLLVLYVPLKTAGLGSSADFLQFYTAGKIAMSDQRAQLYDPTLQSDIQRQMVQRNDPMLFNHPPFEAILYSPLAHFRYPTAFRIWTFLNLSFLGAVFFLLRTYGPPLGLAERLLLLAAAFYPVLAAILQGQDSLPILLAYVGAFLLLRSGRDFSAGLLLGIALIKPQLVLPFALLMLLRARWRFLAGLTASAAALSALSMLVVGPSVVIRYPLLLLHMNDQSHARAFHLFPETMPNLRGFFALLLAGRVSPLFLNLLIAAASLAILFWAYRAAHHAGSFDLSFSVMLAATLLVSFHLLIHDLSLLLLPAFLFLTLSTAQRLPWSAPKIFSLAPLALLFLTFFTMQALGLRNFAVAAPWILWIFAALAVAPSRLLPERQAAAQKTV